MRSPNTYRRKLKQKIAERTRALARANGDLAAREVLLTQILDTSSVGIFLIDMQGRITQANQCMAEMFGCSIDALVGSEYVALVHPAEREIGRQTMRALLDSEILSTNLDRLFCRSDRTEFWGHLTGKRLYGADGVARGIVAVILNITERKQAEKFEQFRSRILELLAGEESLVCILEAIVRGVEQINPAMLCSILLIDKEGRHLGQGVAPSLPDFFSAAIDGIEIGMGVGSCGTAAFTGERVIVEDIATHPYWVPYQELACRADLRACWSQPIRTPSGQVLGTFAIYHRAPHAPGERDISIIEQSARLASIAIEQSVAAAKLRDSESHYRLLTEDVSDVVWKHDRDHRFTYVSPADERLRGYRADEVIGQHIFELLTEEGIAGVKEKFQQREVAEQGGTQTKLTSYELQQRCKDGSLIWMEVFSTPERDGHGEIIGYHGITRDITERKALEEQVRQLAFYDTLTKLPNRRLLDDRMRQVMLACKRSGCYATLMFLDLDNFKPLNDRHGHVVGDLLLVEVARRLQTCVREKDTVSRFGGDEFVVMLADLVPDKTTSASYAAKIAESIRTALSEPYRLTIEREGQASTTVEHRCTVSIGVALFINMDVSQDDVFKWADAAMYQAKEAGRNLIRFHD